MRLHLALSPRLHFKYFNGEVEARAFPTIFRDLYGTRANHSHWPYRWVVWSDVTRYLLLVNYGGCFINLDGVILAPFSTTLATYGAPAATASTSMLFNLSPTRSKSFKAPLCANHLLLQGAPKPLLACCCSTVTQPLIEHNIAERRPPGSFCIFSNGLIWNVPLRHWLFHMLLTDINKKNRHHWFLLQPLRANVSLVFGAARIVSGCSIFSLRLLTLSDVLSRPFSARPSPYMCSNSSRTNANLI